VGIISELASTLSYFCGTYLVWTDPFCCAAIWSPIAFLASFVWRLRHHVVVRIDVEGGAALLIVNDSI